MYHLLYHSLYCLAYCSFVTLSISLRQFRSYLIPRLIPSYPPQVSVRVDGDSDASWAISAMYRLKALALDAYRQAQQAAADARVAQEDARQSRLRIGSLQVGGGASALREISPSGVRWTSLSLRGEPISSTSSPPPLIHIFLKRLPPPLS